MKGGSAPDIFTSNIGTPQGDSLSPVLFIIYLENALRKTRDEISNDLQNLNLAYADDVDFVSSTRFVDVNIKESNLAEVRLFVTTSKTEYTKVSIENEGWR